MKIREFQFPDHEQNKKKKGQTHRDPMVQPKGIDDVFVPPSIEEDPLDGIEQIVHQTSSDTVEKPRPHRRIPRQQPVEEEAVNAADKKNMRPTGRLRRHSRRNRLLYRLGPVAAVLFLFFLWLFLRLAPVPFGTVLIDGNEKMTVDDVYRVSGVYNPINVVQLSPGDIKDKLSHDLRIAEVNVSRELPATIRITMEERKAEGVITTMYGFAYIDKFGVVIALEPQIKGVSVPILTGKKMDTLLLGDVVTDNTVQAALAYLQCLTPEQMNRIAEVNVGNPDKIIAYTTDSIPIRLGTGDEPKERARVTEELLQEVQQNHLSVQYIDTDVKAPLVKSK